MTRLRFILCMLCCWAIHLQAQVTLSGVITDSSDDEPVEFATVTLHPGEQWCMTDREGAFTIKANSLAKTMLRVTCVGYEPVEVSLDQAAPRDTLRLSMRPSSLQLEQVIVTAQRKSENATTSYLIDRQALDNQQIVNVSDIMTLLPGGKTVNSSLITDQRIALRAESGEKGNAAFGTAIEVDGQRLQNNAEVGETTSASTRTVSSTNVESIEVVPGIPSVEYGDLSNGIVKVRTKRGRTPWEVALSTNPYTKQVGVSKGFDLSHGVINASFEHTRSYSNLASPHTAYQRNSLSLNYNTSTTVAARPLMVNVKAEGNLGGYNNEADPDQFVDTYTKVRDRVFRGSLQADWNLDRAALADLSLQADVSVADKRRTSNVNASSSSSQAQIHALEAGYYLATDYDENPKAPIVLGPTGYWYVKSQHDNKPMSLQFKVKARWNQQGSLINNRIMAGAEWSATGNNGRGLYYDDMRYAPTWREYRYDKLPWMHNVALYAEDRFTLTTNEQGGLFQVVAGVRADVTHISRSEYGTVSSLSPRVNLKYSLWQHRTDSWLEGMSVYCGWGKSVKLPSFEVLYPQPSYADRLAFVPGSTADNRVFYAYSVTPFRSIANSSLKWQYAHQLEMGVEARTRVATVSLGAFFARTYRPYLNTSVYTPFSYSFTSQASLEQDFPISSGNRIYQIDRQTGVVTVSDRTGQVSPQVLPNVVRNTFNANSTYTNGSPISRSGLDWVIDFAKIEALRTSVRYDGSYYHYHGVEHTLIAAQPTGAQWMSDGVTPYQYVGYYQGTALGSGNAMATVPNGSRSDVVNSNVTVVTHIPAIRLIISLRLESTLYDCRRSLSQGKNGASRGYVLADPADYFGTPYTGKERDCYVALWPEYYTTWDQPDVPQPFSERFTWARDHDTDLFNELAQLVVKTNYNYNLNPDRISAYLSGNINITKEIGDHINISFLANNFWNSMARIKSRQTGLRSTIYNSGYIPPFYYGISMRVKL